MTYLTRLVIWESGLGSCMAEYQIWDRETMKWVTKVKIPFEMLEIIKVARIPDKDIEENLYIQDKLLGLVEHE